MIEVEGPDGSIIEFPDGTSDDVMNKALRAHFGTAAASAKRPAPNPFDQFDPPAKPAAAEPNPFDQFDAPAKPAAAGPNPFDQFDAPAKPQIDGAGDIGGGIVTGLVNAATGLVGMPGMIQQAEGALYGKALGAMGFPTAAEAMRSAPTLPTQGSVNGLIEKITGPLYKPQTGLGHLAQTTAEFAPGAALGPGGIIRKIMETAVPALASEGAGHLAKGTSAEPYAAPLAALAGGLGTAGVVARASAGDRAVVAATRGTAPEQIRGGQPVLDTGAGIGVPLSGPEGIQFATNSGTKLGDLQRVVEGSVGGGPTMAQFYADRPAQMRAATDRALDTIAPQSANPSTLGPRVAEAAQGSLDEVRQGINAATRPAYAAAEAHVMDPADLAPMRTPAFEASLNRLRNDPVLGPEIQDLPDGSGRVIDMVTKDMGARSEAHSVSGEGFNPLLSERYGSGAADARDILRDPARGGVQAYDDALTAQAQARAQNLDPLTQGPLGDIAGRGGGRGTLSGTQATGDSILPSTASRNQQGELADATRRIGALDPEGIAQLVRQRFADQYEHSATGLVGGPAQGGGAKFAKDIAGDQASQKQANIDAVLGALPNSPAAPQSVNTLLDTLRATGMRRPAGSNTAADRASQGMLSELGPAGQAMAAARTQGRSLLAGAGDSIRRAQLGRQTGRLADLFTAPDSANRIADIVQRGVEPVYGNSLARFFLQSPGAVNAR